MRLRATEGGPQKVADEAQSEVENNSWVAVASFSTATQLRPMNMKMQLNNENVAPIHTPGSTTLLRARQNN